MHMLNSDPNHITLQVMHVYVRSAIAIPVLFISSVLFEGRIFLPDLRMTLVSATQISANCLCICMQYRLHPLLMTYPPTIITCRSSLALGLWGHFADRYCNTVGKTYIMYVLEYANAYIMWFVHVHTYIAVFN